MTGLEADPQRQAHDALRGYVYQIVRSVLTWLELGDGEELYLEGAEDIDRIDQDEAVIDQVKDTSGSGNITLRTASVVEAINNFWTHTNRNPGTAIHFRYVTTSGIGPEIGAPFGAGGGLLLWNGLRSSTGTTDDHVAAASLASFLLAEGKVAEPVRNFLASAPPPQVLDKLIKPIEWLGGQQRSEALIRKIKDRLVVHGHAAGVGPADSELVFHILYTAAFDAAKAKDGVPLTRAEFLRIFAGATAIQIPKQGLVALVQAAMNPGLGAGAVLAAVVELEGPPPLPATYFRRIEQEEKVAEAVAQGSVLLYGATGTGKTLTAASTFAGQKPAWLTLRDLSPAEVKHRLKFATDALRAAGKARTLVVDDIDTLSDPRLIEGALAALWNTQKTLGGRLVVTADRSLPGRLAQAIELEPARELQMQPLDSHDIELFLRQSGCPSERAETWSKLLELSTSGHPQLVNARIATLTAQGYPEPGAQDIFQVPPDIDRIRFEARRIISSLPDGARELLYRASLLTGTLTRPRLMAVTRLKAPIGEPGEAVDIIAGPWLELTDTGDYRVSPLAKGAADQARGQDWVKSMHGQLAWIYLLDRNMTPWDVSSVLMHCYVGGTAGPLVHILQGVFAAPDDVWTAIGQACGMYTALALEPDASLPFQRPADIFVFRIFQYRIAAETNSEMAMRIAAKLDGEFEAAPDDDVTRFFRFLYLSQVLTILKVRYPIAVVVQRACEFFELAREMEETLPDRMARAGMEAGEEMPAGSYIQFAGMRLLSHIEDIDEFTALIAALKALDPAEAAAILESIAGPEGLGSVLIERLWLSDYQANRDRWPQFQAQLREAFDLAAKLGATMMARAIAPVLVRVIDEDVGDAAAAVREDDVLGPIVGDDPIYRCALAKAVSHAGDFPRALALWREALPRWPDTEGDIGAAFAYRSAAIAAAANAEWGEAAILFDAAGSRAGESDRLTFVLGLAMDAAFSRFMAGERALAVSGFGSVVAALEPLQADLEREPLLSLQRRVGGILSAINGWTEGKRTEQELSNLKGLCSNVDPLVTEATVAPPLDTLRMDLVHVELAHGQSLDHSKREAPKLRATPYVSFRAVTSAPLFRLAQRTLDFEHVVADGLRQLDALAVLAEKLASGARDVLGLHDGQQRDWTPGADELVVGHLVAAIFELAAASELDRIPIDTWRADGTAHPQAGRILGVIDHIEGLLVTGTIDAWPTVVRCESGDWSRHLVSALAATLLDRLAPEPLLRCHALWVHYFSQIYFHDLVPSAIARLASRQWQEILSAPALFVSPRRSLAKLRAAIDDPSDGWAKTRGILMAAMDGIPLAQEDEARRSIEALVP
jgi:hypothetical protein